MQYPKSQTVVKVDIILEDIEVGLSTVPVKGSMPLDVCTT